MTDIRDADTVALPAVAAPTTLVNGVSRPWADGTTVATLVGELLGDGTDAAARPTAPGPGATGVAVALDDTIVPRGLWATTPVPAGARVEVVSAVQGG